MPSFISRFGYFLSSFIWWASLLSVLCVVIFLIIVSLSTYILLRNPQAIENIVQSNTFVQKAEIGSIDVSWNGIYPLMQVKDVVVRSDFFSMEISEFTITPKIIESLKKIQPVFDTFYIKKAKVDVHIALSDNNENIDLDTIMQSLLMYSNFGNSIISQSSVYIHYKNNITEINVDYLRSNHDKLWWIDAKVDIPSIAQNIFIDLKNHRPYPKSLDDMDMSLQVTAKKLQTPNSLKLEKKYKNITIDNIRANVHYAKRKILHIKTNMSGLAVKDHKKNSLSLSAIAWLKEGITSKDQFSLHNYNIWVPSVYSDKDKVAQDLYLDSNKKNIYAYISQVQLTKASNFLKSINFLPSNLDIEGTARDVSLLIPLNDISNVIGRIKLQDTGVYETKNNLQISGVTSEVIINQGVMRTKLNTKLQLGLYDIYKNAWNFDNISGELEVYMQDNDILRMNLKKTQAIMDEFQATISLHVAIPTNNALLHEPIFDLHANFLPIPISYKDIFIPYLLLGENIENTIRPMLEDGSMQGSIYLKIYNDDRNVEYGLDLDFKETNVNYLPNRPKLTNVNGSLFLDQHNMQVNGFGEIYGERININNITLVFDSTKFSLDAHTTQNLPKLLLLARDFLENDQFHVPSWMDVSGDVDMQISLNLPLIHPEQLSYTIDLALQQSQITFVQVPEVPLQIKSGAVRIHDGFFSQTSPLLGSWYKQKIQAYIKDIYFLRDKTLEVELQTDVPTSLLNIYTGVNKKLFSGSGEADIYLRFNIVDIFIEEIRAQIKMQNSTIHLPSTWGKPLGEQFTLTGRYTKQFKDNDAKIQFLFPGYARGNLLFAGIEKPLRGNINLGFSSLKEIATDYQNLIINASLTSLDIELWQRWWQNLETFQGDILSVLDPKNKINVENKHEIFTKEFSSNELFVPPNMRIPKATNIFSEVVMQITVGKLYYKKYQVNDISLNLDFTELHSHLHVQSKEIVADIYMPYQFTKPVLFDIHQLHIPKITLDKKEDDSTKETTSTIDPLANIAINKIGPINIYIHESSHNKSPLGSWDIKIRSNENGVFIHDIHAWYEDVTLRGSLEWIYTDTTQDHPEALRPMQTTVSIQMEGKNIKKLAQLVDAKRGFFDMYLQWPGSPAGLDIQKVKGNINIDFSEGEIQLESPVIGLLNFIGLFNLEKIGKRLQLDFSDQGSGIAFDKAQGDFSLQNGIVTNVSPFYFNGSIFSLVITGDVDIINEKIHQEMVLRFTLDNALPLGALLLGYTPQTVLLLIFSKYIFDSPLSSLVSGRYVISGTFDDPKFEAKQIFGADFSSKKKIQPK